MKPLASPKSVLTWRVSTLSDRTSSADFSAIPNRRGRASWTSQLTLWANASTDCATALTERWDPAATVSKHAQWPLFAALSPGKGMLLGWLTFTNETTDDLSGQVTWIKPPANGKYYPAGFTLETPAQASRYVPPARGTNVLTFGVGEVLLSGAGLSHNIYDVFQLEPNDKVINLTTNNKLTLVFNGSSGSFSGSIGNPNAPRSKLISFGGTVFQDQDSGYGFFLGTNQSGQVFLGP